MSGAERAVPYFCPFCGEEHGLRPHDPGGDEPGHGRWECRLCRRVFALKLIGLLPVPGTPGTGSGEGVA